MSTSVTPDEYGSLRVVQTGGMSGALCEFEDRVHQAPKSSRDTPFHYGYYLCATPDNRSIVLCESAMQTIRERKYGIHV